MEARLKVFEDINVIFLNGKLDLDGVEEFQRVCKHQFLNQKVVLGLETLNFVGSTGISILLDTIRELQKSMTHSIKIFGASSEYKKIFFANLEENYEFFESEQQAIISFKKFTPQYPSQFQPHIRDKVVKSNVGPANDASHFLNQTPLNNLIDNRSPEFHKEDLVQADGDRPEKITDSEPFTGS